MTTGNIRRQLHETDQKFGDPDSVTTHLFLGFQNRCGTGGVYNHRGDRQNSCQDGLSFLMGYFVPNYWQKIQTFLANKKIRIVHTIKKSR